MLLPGTPTALIAAKSGKVSVWIDDDAAFQAVTHCAAFKRPEVLPERGAVWLNYNIVLVRLAAFYFGSPHHHICTLVNKSLYGRSSRPVQVQ